MQRGTAEQARLIRHAIETGGVDELEHIVAIVKQTGSLEVTRAAPRPRRPHA